MGKFRWEVPRELKISIQGLFSVLNPNPLSEMGFSNLNYLQNSKCVLRGFQGQISMEST